MKKVNGINSKFNKYYKEPVFLFTSSSMRQAAWAGWYFALRNKELVDRYITQSVAALRKISASFPAFAQQIQELIALLHNIHSRIVTMEESI